MRTEPWHSAVCRASGPAPPGPESKGQGILSNNVPTMAFLTKQQ